VTQSMPAGKPVFRKPTAIEVSATIRCNGRMHRIVLTKSGRLVLVDHPDLAAERAMVALGGEKCRCLEVLDCWRLGRLAELPRILQVQRNEAAMLAARRYMLTEKVDPLEISWRRCFALRRNNALIHLAQLLLEQTDYMRSVAFRRFTVRIGPKAIDCTVWWKGRTAWQADISVLMLPQWYDRVYRRGLAVVDGIFVLDVFDEHWDGIRVLAGRQHRWSIYPAEAFIHLRSRRKRKRRVEWL